MADTPKAPAKKAPARRRTVKKAPTPAVGRIVHYYGDGPEAAIITAVHSPTHVTLTVFTPAGVRIARYTEHGRQRGQWEWPPA